MNRPRWAVLVLFLVSIGLVLAGVFSLQAPDTTPGGQPAAEQPPQGSALGLPRRLGKATASDMQTGQAAINTIGALHGHGFALTGGAVARYGEAMVWVAQSRDAQGAADMATAMQKRIAVARSPFTPVGTRQLGSQLVYVLTGMDQTHFYWQAGDKVVWLAAPPTEAEQDLAELVPRIQ